MTPTDTELFIRIRHEDRAAFDEIHRRFKGGLAKHIFRYVKSYQHVEDILQQVFLKVWTNRHEFDDAMLPFAWCKAIATNTSIDFLRSRKRNKARILIDGVPLDYWPGESCEIESPADGPTRDIERQEVYHRVRDSLDKLDPDFRDPITMYYLGEVAYKDIAEKVRIPVGTVKSRIYVAKRKLLAAGELQEVHG
jgi:RNA polymerase sigma-70 factor (ECF subfamily)